MEEVAALGSNPEDALERGLESSLRCCTVVGPAGPAAMFGVVDSGDGCGVVWLLGTDDITLFSRCFLRRSQEVLKDLCAGFTLVGNYVDARNTLHVRWLKWLGFELSSPTPLGPNNLTFLQAVLHV